MKVTIQGIRERLRFVSPDKTEKTLLIQYKTDNDYEGTVFVSQKDLEGKSEKERESEILAAVRKDAKTAAGMIGGQFEI